MTEAGLVPIAEVVVQGLEVHTLPGRNRCYAVGRPDGRWYFVKHARNDADQHRLAHEFRILSALNSYPEDVMGVCPSICHYDAGRRVLVQGWVGNDPARRFPPRKPWASKRRARILGLALASIHRTEPRSLPAVDVSAPPGVLTVSRPSLSIVSRHSSSGLNIFRMLQSDAVLIQGLEELRQSWRRNCLIHGDIRWANIVFGGPDERTSGLKFVDWETASLGDPNWDVGSAFAMYLSPWIDSIPVARESWIPPLVAAAGVPLSLVQPAMAAFWQAYEKGAGSYADLTASVACAGARLVQTAIEQSQGMSILTTGMVFLLQVASNILDDPARASVDLLKLNPQR